MIQRTLHAARRRTPTFAFAACLLCMAAGCGRRTPPQPVSGGTLRVAVFQTLDLPAPAATLDPVSEDLAALVTPPLGVLDERGHLQLLAARDYIDTGGRIDYPLRRRFWDDGAPVVAQDFVLTATLCGDARVYGADRRRVELMSQVTAPTDSVVRFEFLTLYERRVLHSLFMPSPSHLFKPGQDPQAWRPQAACGPFRIAAATVDGWQLVRNDRSGAPPAHLDRVEVQFDPGPAAVERFLAGDLDVLEGVAPEFVPRLRGKARLVALVGRSYVFIGWNLHDARFADRRVRRALAQAVDVRRLIHNWTADQGDPARGPLVPVLAFADTLATLRYDPGAAGRALDAAGWKDSDGDRIRDRRGAQLKFHLLTVAGDALRLGIARDVAADLRRIGVRAEVREVQPAEFGQRLGRRAFEAFVGQWFPDLGLDLDPVWRSDAADRSNFVGYASPEADSLLTRLWHERGVEDRARSLARFQRVVYDDQPYLFLIQPARFVAFAPGVHGAEPTVLSTFHDLPAWWLSPRPVRAAGGRRGKRWIPAARRRRRAAREAACRD